MTHENKHTPGPWAIDEFENYKNRSDGKTLINDANGKAIAYVFNEANARLLAAAPDLLEALEALLLQSVKGHSVATRLEFSEAGRDILKQCKTALAKARDQQ